MLEYAVRCQLIVLGGVKFFLSVGFQPWELNTDNNNIDLTNGQAHEVIMRRENDGKDVYLQVRRVSYYGRYICSNNFFSCTGLNWKGKWPFTLHFGEIVLTLVCWGTQIFK